MVKTTVEVEFDQKDLDGLFYAFGDKVIIDSIDLYVNESDDYAIGIKIIKAITSIYKEDAERALESDNVNEFIIEAFTKLHKQIKKTLKKLEASK